MGSRLHIVGGGPAGAGAALAAAKQGYVPVVFESFDKLALKPCGNAIPIAEPLILRIPKEAVLNRVRKAKVWVDGFKIFETHGFVQGFEGVIADKRLVLEAAFADANAEVVYNAKYNVRTGMVKVGGELVELKNGIFAGGFPYYEGDKVPIIQALMSNVRDFEKDSIELYYVSDLIGYYYIFPYGDEVEVGVGGFTNPLRLERQLMTFIEKDERLRNGKVVYRRFSQVSVGGPKPGYVNGLVKVGEAAGYVFPLTGEGIRPSALSGYIVAEAIIQGRDPVLALRRSWVHKATLKQRALLELTMDLETRKRGELLKRLSPEDHTDVVLGIFSVKGMARILLKLLSWEPSIALKSIKALLAASRS